MTDARLGGNGSLEGRVAIVTAAGSGIGQATVATFAARGASVLAVDIDGDRLKDTLGLVGDGARVVPCIADATTPAGASLAVQQALGEFGRLDVLANIVGGGMQGDTPFVNKAIHEFTDEEWEAALRFNLTSAFFMCRAAVPALLASGRAAIVNVSSAAAIFAISRTGPYAAAKGGISALTATMALDYAPAIRVNCVAPGTTLTPLMRRVRTPEEIDRITGASMLRRGAEPSEVASVIAFLASDDASYVTGEVIPVHGGLRASTGL